MLIRFVRMTFQEDRLADFLAIFEGSKRQIRAFPGCLHLELRRDLDNPNVRMTHSIWASAEALEAYRQSALFRTTWAATKVLFSDKPLAFSTETVEIV
ncbi:putative quinol monooxygenase [Fibrella aquatilis]|uniref:Antibiotic biosynthesis monooxygenase n=1 Tax=Fibrella aquatilis TaxID=2817059 RepID=A0A939G479_9BACT|nr:antibiotic biosynthesis monooxygenase family protein [Fibrella aquatilis]MBO0930913.1 antibiotic biosynthesis monooxygenase [Fibrella aquatilis]